MCRGGREGDLGAGTGHGRHPPLRGLVPSRWAAKVVWWCGGRKRLGSRRLVSSWLRSGGTRCSMTGRLHAIIVCDQSHKQAPKTRPRRYTFLVSGRIGEGLLSHQPSSSPPSYPSLVCGEVPSTGPSCRTALARRRCAQNSHQWPGALLPACTPPWMARN